MRHRQDMYFDLRHATRKQQYQSLSPKGFSLTTALTMLADANMLGEAGKILSIRFIGVFIFPNSIQDDCIIFTIIEQVFRWNHPYHLPFVIVTVRTRLSGLLCRRSPVTYLTFLYKRPLMPFVTCDLSCGSLYLWNDTSLLSNSLLFALTANWVSNGSNLCEAYKISSKYFTG